MHVQRIEELRINCSQMVGMRAFHVSSRGLELYSGGRDRRPAMVRARTLRGIRWSFIEVGRFTTHRIRIANRAEIWWRFHRIIWT